MDKFVKRTVSLSSESNDSQEDAESTKKKPKLVNRKYDESYVSYGFIYCGDKSYQSQNVLFVEKLWVIIRWCPVNFYDI